MTELRNIIALALVAIVAMAGLLLSNGHTAALSAEAFGARHADQQLGFALGQQAYAKAKTLEQDRNRACSPLCSDLCPKPARWRGEHQKTTRTECVGWCIAHCERLEAADYGPDYERN